MPAVQIPCAPQGSTYVTVSPSGVVSINVSALAQAVFANVPCADVSAMLGRCNITLGGGSVAPVSSCGVGVGSVGG
jgi:hypothetical protein